MRRSSLVLVTLLVLSTVLVDGGDGRENGSGSNE